MLETNRVYAAMCDQPLFKYAVRRVRWAKTVNQLRRYNWRAALIVHGLIIGLWALLVYMSAANHYAPNPNVYFLGSPVSQSANFIAILMLVSVGMDIILDFACLVFSITSIGGEVSDGRWDLLRMTPIHEESIIAAKYGLAQVRSWRVMALVLWTRTAAVILLLLQAFVLPILFGGSFFLHDLFRYEFFNPLLILITFGITLAIYVIEPVWRMHALAAVGIAISARVYSLVYAFLTAFGAMVGIWISQAVIMFFMGWITVQIANGLTYGYLDMYMCAVLPACIATAYIIRAYYANAERWALEYATRRIYYEASR
jgi:hypothetical protein